MAIKYRYRYYKLSISISHNDDTPWGASWREATRGESPEECMLEELPNTIYALLREDITEIDIKYTDKTTIRYYRRQWERRYKYSKHRDNRRDTVEVIGGRRTTTRREEKQA